jgi:hypothetical protein
VIRSMYRLLGLLGDAKAASRSPSSHARRKIRSRIHREVGKATRRSKWLRP